MPKKGYEIKTVRIDLNWYRRLLVWKRREVVIQDQLFDEEFSMKLANIATAIDIIKK